jgi:hypothetical protein
MGHRSSSTNWADLPRNDNSLFRLQCCEHTCFSADVLDKRDDLLVPTQERDLHHLLVWVVNFPCSRGLLRTMGTVEVNN